MPDIRDRIEKRVLAVGDFRANDPVKGVWEEEAGSDVNDCEAMSLDDYGDGLEEPSLLLVHFGLKPASTLNQVIRSNSRKVIYLPPGGRKLSPHRAIRFCVNHQVRDVIGGDQDDFPAFEPRLVQFRERLRRMFEDKDLYDTLDHAAGVVQGDTCNINAVHLATRAGFGCQISTWRTHSCVPCHDSSRHARLPARHGHRDESRCCTHECVRHGLEDDGRSYVGRCHDSKVNSIVANVHSSRGEFSPNMFYEIGFSQALDDRIILPYQRAGNAALLGAQTTGDTTCRYLT